MLCSVCFFWFVIFRFLCLSSFFFFSFLNVKKNVGLFCQQGSAQKAVASSDDIKDALFRNAGYGGKCL